MMSAVRTYLSSTTTPPQNKDLGRQGSGTRVFALLQ